MKIFLINDGIVPHYRVPVYNYLSEYLRKYDRSLVVISGGVQKRSPFSMSCEHISTSMRFTVLVGLILKFRPDAIILWTSPRLVYSSIILFVKIFGVKIIHWGHRRPLPPFTLAKKISYNLEHLFDNAIILYSNNMREYVFSLFQRKVFVANNTLNLFACDRITREKKDIKTEYGIATEKNIICMGRIQKRKRIGDLVRAFKLIDMKDVGLILVGPDEDGILDRIKGERIYITGPLYGEKGLELLSASDVYCMPGAMGLSIVDAFYYGLPVVTENVLHGPEIMYLRDGVNGFVVPEGDVIQLASKLRLLLEDSNLRKQFSDAAKDEITTKGHIDRMCEGFRDALRYVGTNNER